MKVSRAVALLANKYIMGDDTLVLVHILFRHGDRTPEREAMYPKDPHHAVDFYPIGFGQLTNKGKQRAYKLGQVLRKKYDKLIGHVYTPDVVDPITSDYGRTKMTLQLVLAALFPPKLEQVWNETLPWQPIPYNYLPQAEDKLIACVLRNPAALEIYAQHMKGDGKIILENNSSVVEYIEKHSGLLVTDTRQILRLACTLQAEVDLGMQLPDWTKTIWPHPLEELATCEYDVLAAHPKLKSLACGSLLEKILNDSKLTIEQKSKCKMHLYSAHEINVGTFLRCLGIFHKNIPPYCTNVRVELHRIEGVYGFKIYYHTDLNDEPELLVLPACDNSFCPIETFEKLIDPVVKGNSG